MKKTILIVAIAVLAVFGGVLGYLLWERHGEVEVASEPPPAEEVRAPETTPQSKSIYFTKKEVVPETGHIGPSSLGLSPGEFAKLVAKSKKLGMIPEGEPPVAIEDFDYLTFEEKPPIKENPIEELRMLANEAQKQKFIVRAQPYFILRGAVPRNPEELKVEVGIPVIKTFEPKPPLVLRHASIGRAFVSEATLGKDKKNAIEWIKATIERAKKTGAKVSDTIWVRVEDEDWAKKKGPEECLLKLVVPIE
jgi:hypothetical protein